jgi:hypothetical protein
MTAISAQAVPRISEFYGQSFANLAWACAAGSFYDTPLLNALSSAAIPMIGEPQS